MLARVAVEVHGVAREDIAVTGDLHRVGRHHAVFVGQGNQALSLQFNLRAGFLRVFDGVGVADQGDLLAIVGGDALLGAGVHLGTAVAFGINANPVNVQGLGGRIVLGLVANDLTGHAPAGIEGFDREIGQAVVGVLAHRLVGLGREQYRHASDQPPAGQCQQGHHDQGQVNAQLVEQAAQPVHAEGPACAWVPTWASKRA